MLKDIDRQYSIIHIAGREYRVRYSLNAMLCLEKTYKPLSDILKTDFEKWSMEDILQLCRAAMCSLRRNRNAVNRRDFDNIRPSVSELGELVSLSDLPLLRLELISAIADSMPNSETAEQEKSSKSYKEGHQRAVYVDIIGRPEREFWNSTNREIYERIDYYLEAKGEKEAADLVQEFDDD